MPALMTIACCGAVGIFPFTLSGRLPTFAEIGVALLVLRDGLVLMILYLANLAMLGQPHRKPRIANRVDLPVVV
jgi:hypothetical protein